MSRTLVQSDSFSTGSGLNATNWTDTFPAYSDIDVTGGVAQGSSDQVEAGYWSGAGTWSNDQYSSARVVSLSFLSSAYIVGVIVRGTGQNATRSYYSFYLEEDGGGPTYTTVLSKTVNGTETILHSGAVSWAVNDLIELEVSGTTLTPCKNGTPVSGFSLTDSTFATGRPGITLCRTSSQIDDWTGGTLSGGGAAARSNLLLLGAGF